jgi:hypothetical protein
MEVAPVSTALSALGRGLSENDIREFFVVKFSVAIAVVKLEELMQVGVFHNDSHFGNGFLESREIYLA